MFSIIFEIIKKYFGRNVVNSKYQVVVFKVAGLKGIRDVLSGHIFRFKKMQIGQYDRKIFLFYKWLRPLNFALTRNSQ